MASVVRIVARAFLMWVLYMRLRADRKTSKSRRVTAPPAEGGSNDVTGSRRAMSNQTAELKTDQPADQGVPSQTASSPGPDTPLELQRSDWKQALKRTLKEIKAPIE